MNKTNYILLVLVFLTSCNTTQTENKSDNLLMATLYNNYAAEYDALAYQAYNIASYRIIEIKKAFPDRTDLAIVLDIDETVLNNSPYQAKLIHENISYDSCWNEWCNAALAKSIPGAIRFLDMADSLGFNIFYLSNRKEKYVKEGTIINMDSLGFPQVSEDHFLLRTTDRSKTSRRELIENNYEIVMLVGDNLGDFFEDSTSPTERSTQVIEMQKEFGEKFIVLPNAMYGNWVDALGIRGDQGKIDSLLMEMIGGTW